jgi:hypothetical protein
MLSLPYATNQGTDRCRIKAHNLKTPGFYASGWPYLHTKTETKEVQLSDELSSSVAASAPLIIIASASPSAFASALF